MPAPSGSTTHYGFAYLLESDVPDIATASEDLAVAVDSEIYTVATSVTTETTRAEAAEAVLTTGVAIKIHNNATISPATATWTQVPVASVAFSAGSGLSLGSSYDVVVANAGLYRASGIVDWNGISGASAGAICEAAIYQNGSLVIKTTVVLGTVSQEVSVPITTLLNCGSGDTVTLYCYQNTGVNQTLYASCELCVEHI